MLGVEGVGYFRERKREGRAIFMLRHDSNICTHLLLSPSKKKRYFVLIEGSLLYFASLVEYSKFTNTFFCEKILMEKAYAKRVLGTVSTKEAEINSVKKKGTRKKKSKPQTRRERMDFSIVSLYKL